MFEDKTLVCRDCNDEFIFTGGEQEFYQDKGFTEPKTCKICRGKNNARKEDRPRFTATCAGCGEEAILPFKPSGERPVYCSNCFERIKAAQ